MSDLSVVVNRRVVEIAMLVVELYLSRKVVVTARLRNKCAEGGG